MKPRFFKDFNVSKESKIAIDGLERVIPSRKRSHNAGWVKLYKNMLYNNGWKNVTILKKDDSYDKFDVLIVSLGVSYGGSVNFFFGVDENVCWRFSRIEKFKGQIFVMNHDMPLAGTVVKKRIDNNSTHHTAFNMDLGVLDQKCKNTKTFDQISPSTKLCFGDSHCFSTYRPGYNVCRNDGLTLYSILRDGVKEVIEARSGLKIEDITHLTFYAGNIDIRHHLMRQENPVDTCHDMAIELSSQLRELKIPHVEIVQALPIENESRKLPKTGYYKGTPFFGTQQERQFLVDTFNRAIDRISLEENFTIFKWPREFNSSGELDFEFMESPKSVHLSPLSYRWDLDNNITNEIHDKE